jgi:hypothetical protein
VVAPAPSATARLDLTPVERRPELVAK